MSRVAFARSTFLLAVLLLTGHAAAQESGAASALFEAGLADMQAGRLEAGCPKLAESYRLEVRPGVVFTLAECEAKWGKVASAVAHYDDYLRLFEAMPATQKGAQRERAGVAREQKAALGPRVPKLVLRLPASAPPGTVVKREGTVLGTPSLGTELPVDPGKQSITTQTPDGGAVEQEVVLTEGQTLTVDLALPPPKHAAGRPPPPVAAKPHPTTSRRPWIYVAFGLGGAGIALGAVTGALAISKKGDIESNCAGLVCNEEGKQTADRAQTLGWVSTVGFAVGGAAAGAGVVLLLTEPAGRKDARASQVRARLALGPGTIHLSGEL